MNRKIVYAGLFALLAGCGSDGTGGQGGAGGASGNGGAGGVSPSGGTGGMGGGGGGSARTITFTNKCAEPVWVGALNATPEYVLPDGGGWKMEPGQVYSIGLPEKWGGRFWGRSGCSFDSSGNGSCASGDCGGKEKCGGIGGATPATLAEVTFSGFGGKDFYDISLVDGYNLPMSMAPKPGTFTPSDPSDMYDCGAPGCTSDLNATCPPELQKVVGTEVVGCLSACEKFKTDAYCCKGANNTPATCPPTNYSQIFKAACPTAYSYAYDDQTSTFTCKGTDYLITFCP